MPEEASNAQYTKRRSITTKFILWFLFVSLAPLTIATFISYNSSRQALKQEAANLLRAVADNKANQIRVYLADKEKSLSQLSFTSDFITAADKFNAAYDKFGVDSVEYQAIAEEFGPFLRYNQKLSGFDELFLISSEGEVIFSTNQWQEQTRSLHELALQQKTGMADVFLASARSLKTEVSDFEYSPEGKKAVVYIASPILSGARFARTVIVRMDNEGLSEFMHDYTGLGETGEAGVFAKIKDELVFITPLRFDPEATLKRKIDTGNNKNPELEKFIEQQKKTGISVDYRGKTVLSAWKAFPTFRLGMMVKMDALEVMASARRLRNTLFSLSLALILVVVAMAISISRSISKPIKELTGVSGIISEGNLSTRAVVYSDDEIGELAEAFNRMTDNLVEAKASVEQKRDELEVQKKLLEKANQELDSFVYTASHDLRAPLRAISSFAAFLSEDYKDKLEQKGRDFLHEIQKGAERMNRLIEDLLKLSRISRIKNPYEEVNMRELVDSVIERIKFDVEKNNVDLSVPQNLGVVRCDRIKIAEVFLNLINNAIKFSSKDSARRPRVEIGYSEEEERHVFYIKDNGIGIDPKFHQQIFGIFQRLHTQEEYEGTGAGLSIVKRVIDDHGGELWIDSKPGEGAAFYFTIPKNLKE